MESALTGTPLCGVTCQDQLANTLTVHIRARFTNFSVEWLESNPTVPTADLLRSFLDLAEKQRLEDDVLGARLSQFFMERLTLLFERWLHGGGDAALEAVDQAAAAAGGVLGLPDGQGLRGLGGALEETGGQQVGSSMPCAHLGFGGGGLLEESCAL